MEILAILQDETRDVMSLKHAAEAAVLAFGLAAPVLADNPLSSYHYLADPAAFATEDEFYILTDTDDESPNTGENDYTIRSLYILSSKDMKFLTLKTFGRLASLLLMAFST